ncbi:transposase [Xenorhabdus sp. psl]|nr:transposase [Xenorhabdus sp. psl]
MPIITGGGAKRVEIPYFQWVNTIIGNVKNSIRGIYHWISKKHLPRYIGEFCFRFNWRFNLKKTFEQLISSCIQAPPMPEYLLKLAEFRW